MAGTTRPRVVRRSLSFFITPEEFWPLFWQAVRGTEGFVIFSRSGRPHRLEVATPGATTMQDGSTPTAIYVSSTRPRAAQLAAEDALPARWGWIQAGPPRREGRTLLLSEIALKVFVDAGSSAPDAVLRLCSTLVRAFKKATAQPTWARSVHGGAWRKYKDIRTSAGAREWARNLGQLRQWGVDNIEFSAAPHTNKRKPRSTTIFPSD